MNVTFLNLSDVFPTSRNKLSHVLKSQQVFFLKISGEPVDRHAIPSGQINAINVKYVLLHHSGAKRRSLT